MTDEQEREIAFRAQAEDVKHLALEFGVSDRTVYRVWRDARIRCEVLELEENLRSIRAESAAYAGGVCGQAQNNELLTEHTGTSPAE